MDTNRMQDLMEQMDKMDMQDNSIGCLHEALEESKPQNHKGGAHMLACPCPMCSIRC